MNKRVKPPVIPDPELRKTANKSNFESSDSNPYLLLDENFSAEVYDKDVELYSNKDASELSLKKYPAQKVKIKVCTERLRQLE